MSGATAGAVAAAAAISNAIKASGAIVRIEPDDFSNLIAKVDNALVIESKGGVFSTHYKYLSSYKGFVFYCKSKDKLSFSSRHEVMQSQKIWVPE